jgi:hypothetical protein
MNSKLYLHLALTRHWKDVREDRDIPFIGLSLLAQEKVRRTATLLMLEEEPKRLRRNVMNYPPASKEKK